MILSFQSSQFANNYVKNFEVNDYFLFVKSLLSIEFLSDINLHVVTDSSGQKTFGIILFEVCILQSWYE